MATLLHPLVFAHVNGFATLGAELPKRDSRSNCLTVAQGWVGSIASGSNIAYLVGEYVGGARVAAVPLDYAPPIAEVCVSRRQRLSLLASGATFVWCTLAALSGTEFGAVAARAVLATESFIKPVSMLADYAPSGSAEPLQFRFGASAAASIIRRPILDSENSPPAWHYITLHS